MLASVVCGRKTSCFVCLFLGFLSAQLFVEYLKLLIARLLVRSHLCSGQYTWNSISHHLWTFAVNSSSAALQIATHFADVYCSELHIHWSSVWLWLAKQRDFSRSQQSIICPVYSLGNASVVAVSDAAVRIGVDHNHQQPTNQLQLLVIQQPANWPWLD